MNAFKRMSVGLVAAQIFVQLFCSGTSFAQEGSYHCASFPQASDMGVCGNRRLPADRIRNLRGLHLECGSGVDHYVRTFIPFNYKAWKRLENSEGQKGMQEYRKQNDPLIKWSGAIPYETVEAWRWTECYFGPDAGICGTHQECHDEIQYETDKDGKQVQKTVRVCVDVANNCWHDEDRSESRYCSTERVDFQAEFARDPNWGPGSKGYYDVIPNKYDLLPGEVEDVQVFANTGRSTTVTPSVEVGDAWNKYNLDDIRIVETGGRSASCEFGKTWNAVIKVHTNERIYGKTTPNAFRIPVDGKGKERNPLHWDEVINEKQDAKNPAIRYKPRDIELMDVSHTMISSMARQSRKFETLREEAKAGAGKGGTQTPENYTKAKDDLADAAKGDDKGFYKSTNVRIRMKKITGALSMNIRPVHNIFTSGSESTIDGIYDLELVSEDSDHDLYRASGPWNDEWWDWKSYELERNQKYKFLISMYQEGVPFYKQAKNKKSSSAYSKELEINFKTEDLDKRDLMQKFITWQGLW